MVVVPLFTPGKGCTTTVLGSEIRFKKVIYQFSDAQFSLHYIEVTYVKEKVNADMAWQLCMLGSNNFCSNVLIFSCFDSQHIFTLVCNHVQSTFSSVTSQGSCDTSSASCLEREANKYFTALLFSTLRNDSISRTLALVAAALHCLRQPLISLITLSPFGLSSATQHPLSFLFSKNHKHSQQSSDISTMFCLLHPLQSIQRRIKRRREKRCIRRIQTRWTTTTYRQRMERELANRKVMMLYVDWVH